MKNTNTILFILIIGSLLIYRWLALMTYDTDFVPAINIFVHKRFSLVTLIISVTFLLIVIFIQKLSLILKAIIIILVVVVQARLHLNSMFSSNYDEEIIQDLGNDYYLTRVHSFSFGFNPNTCHVSKFNYPFQKKAINIRCKTDTVFNYDMSSIYIKRLIIKRNPKRVFYDTIILKKEKEW